MSTYFALLTTIGQAKLANATALDQPVAITQMALGDGNGETPTPNESQTALLNEQYRATLNSLSVDDDNPSQIIAELVVPENQGGFWIRELGLFDTNGDMLAIANCPPTYKPMLSEGSGRVQRIRMVLTVSNTSAVTLKIDPAVVLATRDYVDGQALIVHQYVDTQHNSLKAYVDSQDDNLKAYIDAQDKAGQTAAKSDATKKANAAQTAAANDATTKANQALVDAKSYADTQDATTLKSANSHADSAANSALNSAKSDATTKANQALSDAKNYAEDAGNLKRGTVASERLPEATAGKIGGIKKANDEQAKTGTGTGSLSAEQLKLSMDQFGLFGSNYNLTLAQETDVNNIKLSGWYSGQKQQLLNWPEEITDWGYLEVIHHGGDFILQRVTGMTDSSQFITVERRNPNSNWSNWKKQWCSLSMPIPSPDDISQADKTTPSALSISQVVDLIRNKSIGFNQTWVDLSSTYKPNTQYINSSDRPRLVSIFNDAALSISYILINNEYVVSRFDDSSGHSNATSVAIIQPGDTYSLVLNDTAATIIWTELR
ncbi:phage tail protein [Celerinatantimonas sp. YJH-8]|uniref:phage tail-collar fiber domain-containing protein n=1 Tax=Celerinatantimonas sp. YJH-8 TaxID=3228714 RepID=UPI0038C3359E